MSEQDKLEALTFDLDALEREARAVNSVVWRRDGYEPTEEATRPLIAVSREMVLGMIARLRNVEAEARTLRNLGVTQAERLERAEHDRDVLVSVLAKVAAHVAVWNPHDGASSHPVLRAIIEVLAP